jgi:hypothetical protein
MAMTEVALPGRWQVVDVFLGSVGGQSRMRLNSITKKVTMSYGGVNLLSSVSVLR